MQHPGGIQIPLSIASAPWQLPTLELLYRSDGTTATALALDDLLRRATALELEGPLGDVGLAGLAESPDLRLIAAGTGIAQALSLVSELHHQQPQRPIPHTELLWANRAEAVPPVDKLLSKANWLTTVRCDSGSLEQRLHTSLSSKPNAFSIIAGTPDFVYQVQDQLLAANVPLARMAADAFDYAPR